MMDKESYHYKQAEKLSNMYTFKKMLGAPHKRLHNIDRKIKWHIKKMMAIRNNKR